MTNIEKRMLRGFQRWEVTMPYSFKNRTFGAALAVAFMSGMAFAQAGKPPATDVNQSIATARKTAEQGDAKAQLRLGNMLRDGEGMQQNFAEAVQWYRKAADQGDPEAQTNLGAMYVSGRGVPRDYTEAVRWYRKAADQGNAAAQSNLWTSYMQGQGVPEDHSEAARWLRKAAEQGLAQAQYNLAICFYLGDGVPMDRIEAYKWAELAVEGGEEDGIKIRDMASSGMTPNEVAQAQSRTQEWRVTSGKTAQKFERLESVEETYEQADPDELHLAFRASLKQIEMTASGKIAKLDYAITKFAVGASDIALTTDRVAIDKDDERFGSISTKNLGAFRISFNSLGNASLWLKPSQKKELLKLLK